MRAIHVRFLFMLAVLSLGGASLADTDPGRGGVRSVQYQVTELSFTATRQCARPATNVHMEAVFNAPSGTTLTVPAFWDGGRTWRVRFSPTEPGKWTYTTRSAPKDSGLNERSGTLVADKARGENPLHKHGGFLKVSADGHYLTYSDGTPFFWLGDTWWSCPSNLMPFESCYRVCIDTRRRQTFTVAHMAFTELWTNLSEGTFRRFDKTGTLDPMYWQEADRYIEYANQAGIVPVLGLEFSTGMRLLTLEQWRVVWRHVIARYGAYSVTFLICGEYNLENDGCRDARVAKVLALGRFIKGLDPYKRAMTVHPIWHGWDKHQAWKEPWYDFVMLQGGHGKTPTPYRAYFDIYKSGSGKPVLEGEVRYEGILGFNTDDTREAAYRAIQAGSFGFTYGSHGLYYPTQHDNDKMGWDLFGKSPVWDVALRRPGGDQMRHLRSCYESVEWWKLKPKPTAVETDSPLAEMQRILTKADGDTIFLIYFPRRMPAGTKPRLTGVATGSTYSALWFDPRTGKKASLKQALTVHDDKLRLPRKPDERDWMLILRKK